MTVERITVASILGTCRRNIPNDRRRKGQNQRSPRTKGGGGAGSMGKETDLKITSLALRLRQGAMRMGACDLCACPRAARLPLPAPPHAIPKRLVASTSCCRGPQGAHRSRTGIDTLLAVCPFRFCVFQLKKKQYAQMANATAEAVVLLQLQITTTRDEGEQAQLPEKSRVHSEPFDARRGPAGRGTASGWPAFALHPSARQPEE